MYCHTLVACQYSRIFGPDKYGNTIFECLFMNLSEAKAEMGDCVVQILFSVLCVL